MTAGYPHRAEVLRLGERRGVSKRVQNGTNGSEHITGTYRTAGLQLGDHKYEGGLAATSYAPPSAPPSTNAKYDPASSTTLLTLTSPSRLSLPPHVPGPDPGPGPVPIPPPKGTVK